MGRAQLYAAVFIVGPVTIDIYSHAIQLHISCVTSLVMLFHRYVC